MSAPRSIRTRLLLMLLTGMLVPLGVAVSVLVVRDVEAFGHELAERSAMMGRLLAFHSTADLAFEDREEAGRTLAELAAVPEVLYAALYDAEGRLFASHVGASAASASPPAWVDPRTERTLRRGSAHVEVIEPVVREERRFGTLRLRTSTSAIDARLRAHRQGLLWAALGMLAVTAIFAWMLQRTIARPILDLASFARRIAERSDFRERARKAHDDEIGLLADTMNSMLDEVERRQKEAQDAVRARDDFLSVASHELNTPLTALQLGVQNLKRTSKGAPGGGVDPERLERSLDSVLRQVQRLSRLIRNLLDVNRITSGRFQLDREPVDLVTITREVVERFEAEAARAGSELRLSVPDELCGSWDRFRLDQVLTNLLSNALKYGAGKPVEVRLDQRDGSARLEVQDGGIGISEADRERIFAPFERAVSSRQYGGMGMGLFIARQIVAAHGGTITADAAPGAGSTFRVSLPLEPAPLEPPPRASQGEPRTLH